MRRVPDIYLADTIKDWNNTTEIKGSWVLCRPLGMCAVDIKRRLGLAWMVFTGKADVIHWHKQKD